MIFHFCHHKSAHMIFAHHMETRHVSTPWKSCRGNLNALEREMGRGRMRDELVRASHPVEEGRVTSRLPAASKTKHDSIVNALGEILLLQIYYIKHSHYVRMVFCYGSR